MIYYFSATGNNKYVAQRIAEAIGDDAMSIQECTPSLPSSDVVGFVSPTYGWGLPEIMKRFFGNLSASSASYVFFVATYCRTLIRSMYVKRTSTTAIPICNSTPI